MTSSAHRRVWGVSEYDLNMTLDSGQAFRWVQRGRSWEGVIGQRWVNLKATAEGILAESVSDPGDWRWLSNYLGLDDDLEAILAAFPRDPALARAVAECRGLRLLRQDPWECLASFILSSTKQIVQIRQIVGWLCERHGARVDVPLGMAPAWAFPSANVVAALPEAELRACRMGFRARYLKDAAERVVHGELDLDRLRTVSLEEARTSLMTVVGVGRKIADCVLLFSCGQPRAFPVDVWIARVLRECYFGGRSVALQRVERFAAAHFGAQAGYAQQYLFHAARLRAGRVANRGDAVAE